MANAAPRPTPWGSTCSSGVSPGLTTLVQPVMAMPVPPSTVPLFLHFPLCSSVCPSVCLSVPSLQGHADRSGGFTGSVMLPELASPYPHVFPGCFCLYFPHMTFKYSPANPRESNPLVFCVCDCAKFINEQNQHLCEAKFICI